MKYLPLEHFIAMSPNTASVVPDQKPGGLWVEGRALKLDSFFDPSHLFVRP